LKLPGRHAAWFLGAIERSELIFVAGNKCPFLA